jgi:hypothetical protein
VAERGLSAMSQEIGEAGVANRSSQASVWQDVVADVPSKMTESEAHEGAAGALLLGVAATVRRRSPAGRPRC